MAIVYDGTANSLRDRVTDLEGEVFGPNGSAYRLHQKLTGVENIDAATVLSPGGGTARTLAARAGDVINAFDYGVVADGVTDNAAALDAALAAATTNTRPLLLPGGVVATTAKHSLPPHVRLYGGGYYQTIIRYTGAAGSGALFTAGGASANTYGWKIENVTFDAAGLLEYALEIGGTSSQNNGRVQSVQCTRATVAGLHLIKAQIVQFDNIAANSNLGDGVLIEGSVANTACQLYSGSFSYNGGRGVHIKGCGTSRLIAPTIEGNALGGLRIDATASTQHLSIWWPYFEGNRNGGHRDIEIGSSTNQNVQAVEVYAPNFSIASGTDTVRVFGSNTQVMLYHPMPQGLAGLVEGGARLVYEPGYIGGGVDPAANWTIATGGMIQVRGTYADPTNFYGHHFGSSAVPNALSVSGSTVRIKGALQIDSPTFGLGSATADDAGIAGAAGPDAGDTFRVAARFGTSEDDQAGVYFKKGASGSAADAYLYAASPSVAYGRARLKVTAPDDDTAHVQGLATDGNAVRFSGQTQGATNDYVALQGMSGASGVVTGEVKVVRVGSNALSDLVIVLNNSLGSLAERFRVRGTDGAIVVSLPTSSAGLPSGALWNDAGTVKVAP